MGFWNKVRGRVKEFVGSLKPVKPFVKLALAFPSGTLRLESPTPVNVLLPRGAYEVSFKEIETKKPSKEELLDKYRERIGKYFKQMKDGSRIYNADKLNQLYSQISKLADNHEELAKDCRTLESLIDARISWQKEKKESFSDYFSSLIEDGRDLITIGENDFSPQRYFNENLSITKHGTFYFDSLRNYA